MIGVAETSQPLATRPVPSSSHGIAKRPEQYRFTPVCKTYDLPQTMVSPWRPNRPTSTPTQTDGIAETSRPPATQPGQSTNDQHTHRMVSQSVPSGTVLHPCAGRKPTHRTWCRQSVPSEQLSQSRPNGWYRRSVPTVGNPTLHSTTAPHSHRAVSSKRPRAKPNQPPCACLQTDPQTTVSPERPVVDSGHPPGVCGTWPLSVGSEFKHVCGTWECAAPCRSSQCGTCDVSRKKLRPSVLQTKELDLGRHVRELDRVSGHP